MHALHRLFWPRSIAVIGASRTPGKLGYDVLKNTTQFGFGGKVFPINPHAEEILGLPAFPSVMHVTESIDVAIIMIPRDDVHAVLRQCARRNIPFAVIITSGFTETGQDGHEEEERLTRIAQQYGIRVVGPNCIGYLNAHNRLNASFASGMPVKGNVSLLSQSGAMAVALLDWAYQTKLGFAHILSVGNKMDLDEVEALEYFAQDKNTQVIMMYLESLDRGREFVELASRITPKKPIIVLKAGVSKDAQRAVQSHTGALAGSEEALNAAFERAGVIRAHTVEEFFDFGLSFSLQPLPKGNRVAIITNAGGPGIMATDAVDGTKLRIPELPKVVQKTVARGLPDSASTKNPIDVIGDAPAERYEHALHAVLSSKSVDSAIVILTPQVMTEEDKTAFATAAAARESGKPVLASFMGGVDVNSGRIILEVHGIPNYATPERAVNALNQMVIHAQRNITPFSAVDHTARTRGKKILPHPEGHGQIRTMEAEELLAQYRLPVVRSQLITSAKECVKITHFPVVMKIASRDIIHKAAAGAVELNIENVSQAKKAYARIISAVGTYNRAAEIDGVLVQEQLHPSHHSQEMIIGMKRDSSFGPVMMCGLGGSMVEVFHDVTFALAPLTAAHALKMIEQIHSAPLLARLDKKAIARTIASISRMAMDYPQMTSLDINPLIVHPVSAKRGADIVDVRIMTD